MKPNSSNGWSTPRAISRNMGTAAGFSRSSSNPPWWTCSTVGAHYAISSLFEDYQVQDRIFCYTIDREDYRLAEAGKAKLAVGRIQVTSDITWNSATISFAVLHFGDHNLCGGVREFQGEEAYATMAAEVSEAFSWADFPETLRRIDQHFGDSTYSLRSLFRDEQRKDPGPDYGD